MALATTLKKIFVVDFLLGPAIWVSSSSVAKVHQRKVLNFRPSKARWIALLNVVACVFSWYLVLAWWKMLTALMSKHGRRTDFRISEFFYLTFWIGANPNSYYTLGLRNHPKSVWLRFIFPQEVRHWHTIQTRPKPDPELKILNDKLEFYRFCVNNQISTVPVMGIVRKGEKIEETLFFQRKDLFIKPVTLYAMRGCMSLRFSDNSYDLKGVGTGGEIVNETTQAGILGVLQRMVDEHAYLIQPLLSCHKSLALLNSPKIKTRSLATIRVITSMSRKSVFNWEAAVLEIAADDSGRWHQLGVDLDSSRLTSLDAELEISRNAEFVLQPFWADIKRITQCAHTRLSKVCFIGWDIAITDHGPVLLEGNWGWGIVGIQQSLLKPFLSDRVANLYLDINS